MPKSANEALRPEAGTPPPRRSRQSRNQLVVFLNFIVTALMFGVIAGGVLVYYGKHAVRGSRDRRPATSTVMVKPNTGSPGHRRPAASGAA